jgi:micrococcal nuclease
MRVIIFLLMMLSSVAHAQTLHDLRVIRVLDGDTIEIDAPFLPVELRQVLKLRILDVDTPEKGSLAKCDRERKLSEAATNFTRRVVFSATKHQVIFVKWDKYGGRVLGDVLLDGQSLKKMLLDSKHARLYDGKRKASWC